MANLRDYVIRRLLLLIPVIFGITVITFALSHVIPGDPARLICGQKCTPAHLKQLNQQFGYNLPVWDQYVRYMTNLVHGNLGLSTSPAFLGKPVTQVIEQRFPATFELAFASVILVAIFGIITGVLSATHRNKPLDHVTRIIAIAGVSVPVFWLALMLLWFFGIQWHIVPTSGGWYDKVHYFAPPHVTGIIFVDAVLVGNWGLAISNLQYLFLPAVTLAYATTGAILRLTRSSMLEVLGEDYIRTARAKGLSERIVVYKHALRNALIPTVTVLGLAFAGLLAGAVLTESIFAWPGLGFFVAYAVLSQDYNGIMGTVTLVALLVILANLVVDLLYALLDPRIRLG